MIAGCFVRIPDDFDRQREYAPATEANIRAFIKELRMAQAPGKQMPVPPPSPGSGPLPKR